MFPYVGNPFASPRDLFLSSRQTRVVMISAGLNKSHTGRSAVRNRIDKGHRPPLAQTIPYCIDSPQPTDAGMTGRIRRPTGQMLREIVRSNVKSAAPQRRAVYP